MFKKTFMLIVLLAFMSILLTACGKEMTEDDYEDFEDLLFDIEDNMEDFVFEYDMNDGDYDKDYKEQIVKNLKKHQKYFAELKEYKKMKLPKDADFAEDISQDDFEKAIDIYFEIGDLYEDYLKDMKKVKNDDKAEDLTDDFTDDAEDLFEEMADLLDL